MRRRPAVVLGASGLVGQRMQQRLVNHPWFELTAIGGSAASAGKSLEEIPWRLEQERPPLPQVQVLEVLGESFVKELQTLGIEVAFSCLPSDVANQIEPVLVNCGIAVFSNASSFRRELGIPLVIPDINPEHMSEFNSSKGMHACATNCTLVPMAVPIAALRQWDVIKV
ncbi:MAG: aspartate-semialdehyde dehydrogenase, partial [Candidatus Poseidoniales archaeon]